MDGWKTKVLVFEGGLLENAPQIEQGANRPGSAIRLVNFEPYQGSGYRRINGYTKFDDDQVPGSGNILASFVFGSTVIACRGTDIYASGGAGWSAINGVDTRTGAGRYSCAKYNWVSSTIVLVDGVNYPAKWDGSSYTVLNDAAIIGAVDVKEHKNYLFFAKGSTVVFSAPSDDEDYDAANGAGVINVGFTVEALYPWRDILFVFGKDKISAISGSVFGEGGNATLQTVTTNIGCISRFTLQEVGGDVFFLGPDGVRTIAGTANIGDVELEAYTRPIFKTLSEFTHKFASSEFSSLVVRTKSQYRLFGAKTADDPANSQGILGGLKYGDQGNLIVEWSQLRGIKVLCADSGYNADNEIIVHASTTGYVYSHDTGATFDTVPITFSIKTPYIPFDDPEIRKILYKISLYIDGEGAYSYNFAYDFDYGDDEVVQPDVRLFEDAAVVLQYWDTPGLEYDDEVFYSTGFFRKNKFNIEGSCFSTSFEIEGMDESAPFVLKSMNIQYNLGDRR